MRRCAALLTWIAGEEVVDNTTGEVDPETDEGGEVPVMTPVEMIVVTTELSIELVWVSLDEVSELEEEVGVGEDDEELG